MLQSIINSSLVMDYMVHTVASFFIVYHRPLWPNMLLFGFLVLNWKPWRWVVVVISYCSELLIIAPRVSRKCFTNDSYHKTKYTVSNPFACLSHLLLQWHCTLLSIHLDFNGHCLSSPLSRISLIKQLHDRLHYLQLP